MTTRSRTVLLALLGLWGCRPKPEPQAPPLAFPPGFLFGTATAGFQSDMGCPSLGRGECADTASDWYAFVTSPAMQQDRINALAGEDPAVVGPGEWELYAQDFDLARSSLHNNSFRLSIEWSRIFPTSTVGVADDGLHAAANPAALAHYHAVLAALRERGLSPLVTINHYTLPLWISDGIGCHQDLAHCSPRGWLDHDLVVGQIARYAGFVAREFGGEVDRWATLNEPFAVVVSAFLMPGVERSNPPAVLFQSASAKTAWVNMIEAHARMYDAVKANDMVDADGDGKAAEVGLVYAMSPVVPADPKSGLDRVAAEDVFYLWSLAFLDGVALGKLDADLNRTPVDRPDLAGRMDWLGINYYARIVVQGTDSSLLPDFSPLATFDPTTVKTENNPYGIYQVVKAATNRYHLPIIITENDGQAVPRNDMEAELSSTVQCLQWLERAIHDGMDVRGYFYWSLTDNYEWNHGTDLGYGLYQVDPRDPSKARVPRATVEAYGRIAEAGRVPDDLAQRYPVTEP